jgi:hypothetical protein
MKKIDLNDLADKKIINLIKQSGYKQNAVAKELNINSAYLCTQLNRLELTKKVRKGLVNFIEKYNLY